MIIFSGLALLPHVGVAAPPPSEVPASRFAQLTRGLNVAGWFRMEVNPANAEEDLKLLQAMKARHIRLPVGVNLLFNEKKPDEVNAPNLKRLDELLDRILAHDLAVIVEPHDVSSRLWEDPAYADRFARFWTAFARHLSHRDPERIFLEVVNEPSAETAEAWNAVQPKLLRAMREGAPRHTLIANANQRVTANDWDQVRALQKLETVDDPNVVYNFHFYAPMIFTHQGATWGWDVTQHVKNLPYPSSPEAVAPVAAQTPEAARQYVIGYGKDRWNREKIEETLRPAAEWARKNRVRLTCNEFGVYRHVAPEADRNAYIRDVSATLEKLGIGWTMWEYKGGFGVVTEQGGKRIVLPGTARALGLTVPASALTEIPKPRTVGQRGVREMEKAGWRLTFEDEFNGSKLDTRKWLDRYWHGRTHSNNEQQYYAPDGYEVKDGVLRFKAEKRTMGGMPYTSGMISSFDLFAQQYGWFEIRAKFPKGKGMWPAFWLLPATKKWPPEIDVLEILGHETNKVYFSTHWNNLEGKHTSKTGHFTGPDFSQDFHTFAVEWTPKECIWYVDGVERHRSSEGIPHEPMYVIANLAVGGNWPGNPDATTPFPGIMKIDYIRVYQRKEAPRR